MSTESKLSKSELKLKLREFDHEYDLARAGLAKGMFATGGALLCGLSTLASALYAFVTVGPGFLSGENLVLIFEMMIAALVIYFSFVFGRAAKIRMEISKKKLIEISSAENVRK